MEGLWWWVYERLGVGLGMVKGACVSEVVVGSPKSWHRAVKGADGRNQLMYFKNCIGIINYMGSRFNRLFMAEAVPGSAMGAIYLTFMRL